MLLGPRLFPLVYHLQSISCSVYEWFDLSERIPGMGGRIEADTRCMPAVVTSPNGAGRLSTNRDVRFLYRGLRNNLVESKSVLSFTIGGPNLSRRYGCRLRPVFRPSYVPRTNMNKLEKHDLTCME